MSRSTLKAALIQDINHGDADANLSVIEQRVAEAAAAGAELVLLQELHNGAYFCQHESAAEFDRAEAIPGPSTERLSALAAKNSVVLVASLFERRAAGLYHNTAVIFEKDGSLLGKYRKMHIPDDPGFYEKFYFTPGDLGFHPIASSVGKIGVLVCWDQWYPEAARLTSLMGAEILFYPTAIGWATSQDEATNTEQYNAWQTIQRSHAVANGVHVVSVNRVGFEQNGAMKFWGGSFVSNPFGTVLYQGSHDQEETKVLKIDLADSDRYRTHWPFLRDRRIDSYEPITKRYLDEQ